MPNYCDYIMKIKGDEVNCKKFLKRLKLYDEPNHFWRIFDADVVEVELTKDPDFVMIISGYCAWSLETCCRASGYSNGTDLFEVNTRELQLEMEVYSREPGVGFEEHFLYDNGECVEAQCVGMEEWFWDSSEFETYEEYKAEYPDAPPEEEFDDDYARTGGFGDEYGVWNI